MREQYPDSSHQLLQLDHQSLAKVCMLLDPVSLAAFNCTSRETRQIASQTCFWEQLCRHRWGSLNTHLTTKPQQDSRRPQQASDSGEVTAITSRCQQPQQPTVDFNDLYRRNNGWSPLQLLKTTGHSLQLCPEQPHDFCVSAAASANVWPATGDTYFTLSETVELWSTGDGSQPGQRLASLQLEEKVGSRCSCIAEASAGIAAAGCEDGRIRLYNLKPDSDTTSSPSACCYSGNRYLDNFAMSGVLNNCLQVP